MNRLPFRERKERRKVGKRQEREIFAAEGGGEDARESPRVAVVTAWAVREPNKNPMSKICLGQTPPAKKKPADCARFFVTRDFYFIFL